MKNRAIALAMCIVMLLLSGCSTNRYYGGIKERSDGLADAYTQDISPRSQGNAYGDEVSATLYFRYLSEELLAGVEREFHVTAESTLEEMVVQALIDGPQDASYQYNALINPDTELIAVKEQSGYLSVTLSGEFAEKMDEDIIADAQRRRLAVLSIVNSVTSIGNYSRVLILIDDDNNGIGERMTYAEAGWEDMGERTMEPMALDADVILTPENVIDIEPKAEITYDDFAKLQFQVGEIIACEAVKKSKKLLCSQVKIGSQVRQIVSGIKAHYSPEEMVGKKVMVVTNLKPAVLAGIKSEGMILCAEDAEGNLSLMVPEKEMPAGAEIC